MSDTEKNPIIVALDKSTLAEISELVTTLSGHVGCFKIGLEALTALGAPQVVASIHDAGGSIFLDGKFCDIPNTVGKASKAASNLGVKMFNVHASCGFDSVKAAAEHKGDAKLLVVTVLTSISQQVADKIFYQPISEMVVQFAHQAKQAGADGVICSPQELELLQNETGLEDFEKVTPGIRPVWAAKDDQQRIMTPSMALQAGATGLVIGRPITAPPSEIGGPVEAAKKILDELQGVA
ncbi:MAG: orotidine-5'-phosphate decarboxylase [Deltaproteobacteria bacterium]|nr:orotidine-5'-phosphate decarboxylase [Deltaproteobacteria bacterium]